MRFPHAYGPVPTAAVLAVLPYRPGADGAFTPPALPVLDAAGRRLVNEASLLRRAATSEVPVTGGVAVRLDSAPVSRQHNQLLLDGPVDADEVVAEADRTLAGVPHRAALLRGEELAPVAAELRARRWVVIPLVGMAAPAGGTGPGLARAVDVDGLRPVADARWRRDVPGITDEEVRQLSDRYRAEEAVTEQHWLAVHEDGVPVASCLLRLDGATAEVDAVDVDPAHRRRGLGDALLADARARAGAAGCDLVTLVAMVHDHPRHWYERRGFVPTDRAWSVVAPTRAFLFRNLPPLPGPTA
jgi:GNAT superfamily N-acetyltransferase